MNIINNNFNIYIISLSILHKKYVYLIYNIIIYFVKNARVYNKYNHYYKLMSIYYSLNIVLY